MTVLKALLIDGYILEAEKSVNRTQRNIKNDLESAIPGQNVSSASDHGPISQPRIVSIHLSDIGKYVSYGGLNNFYFILPTKYCLSLEFANFFFP